MSYDSTNFENYDLKFLPLFIDQLQRSKSTSVHSLREKLYESICSTCNNLLSEIKNEHHQPTKSQGQMEFVIQLSRHLPEPHRSAIEEMRKKCDVLIKEGIDRVQRIQENEEKSGDFSSLLRKFERDFDKGEFILCIIAKDALTRLITSECSRFHDMINRKETVSLLTTETRAYHIWKQYLETLAQRKKRGI